MTSTPNPDKTSCHARPAGLLVVTIDRIPAWMLAACGATWVATPSLDGLAARGVVFDRVITPSPDAGATLRDLMAAAPSDGASLLAASAAAGWRPVFVTDDAAVAAEVTAGEPRLFAAVRLVEAVPKEKVEEDDTQTNIARLVDAAVDVIATGEHRMVWCHVGSLGVAWDAPERHRDRYIDPEDPPPPSGAGVPGFPVDADTDPDLVVGIRQVFAGQITLLDSQLGRLFAAVRAGKAAVAGDWSVLVVGVRGLPLGLHGWVGIGGRQLPFGELVHVPAILADAAGRMAAQRYGGLVVPADLAATLADMVTLGMARGTGSSPQASAAEPTIDPAEPWKGVSLASLFERWSPPIRDRVIVAGPDGVAIVTPAWHGVLPGGASDETTGAAGLSLFAKPDDYFEQANVADRCHGTAERLAEVASQALGQDPRGAWAAMLPP